ncbi:hypothetical protein P3X46_027150 [Hevea brasiliensis]|uniref:F-box domain-containing protein n=1 Tax=Hevea brasiliensis TaxID=3981 RepID=A0ABQ9KYY4_HEVBR|nr:hypothetical protein P3X46_027150 [Hevea brasiliensis]
MDNNNRNMFSTLTSSRLVLIVNYLPFKEALRTSILSKQWRNVWRETTNLESSFFDFVRKFLACYPQRAIQKFTMSCSKPEGFLVDVEEDDAKKHLAIVELPFQVYQHVSLEPLKFISCNFDVSKFNNFTISLTSIKDLLLGCPLLKSLGLKKCWNIDWFEICKICHFHMYNQREMVEADLDFGMELEFDILGSLLNDFLQKFYAAKVLTVCSVVSLGEETFSLQASLDVRDLILKTAMHSCEFYGIRFMFRSCPKLETLTFDIGPAKIFSLVNLFLANEEDDNGQNRESYMARAHLVKQFRSFSRKLQMLVS